MGSSPAVQAYLAKLAAAEAQQEATSRWEAQVQHYSYGDGPPPVWKRFEWGGTVGIAGRTPEQLAAIRTSWIPRAERTRTGDDARLEDYSKTLMLPAPAEERPSPSPSATALVCDSQTLDGLKAKVEAAAAGQSKVFRRTSKQLRERQNHSVQHSMASLPWTINASSATLLGVQSLAGSPASGFRSGSEASSSVPPARSRAALTPPPGTSSSSSSGHRRSKNPPAAIEMTPPRVEEAVAEAAPPVASPEEAAPLVNEELDDEAVASMTPEQAGLEIERMLLARGVDVHAAARAPAADELASSLARERAKAWEQD